MKIKFQADNDLNEHIIDAVLRLNPVIDFQTAPAAGLHIGVPDEQVLALAAQEGRIVVSHDFATMPYHFANFVMNQSSPGLILVSQRFSISHAANSLHLVWEASAADEYTDRYYHLL